MAEVVSKVKKIRTFNDDVMNARGALPSTPAPVTPEPKTPRVVVIPKAAPSPTPIPKPPVVTPPPKPIPPPIVSATPPPDPSPAPALSKIANELDTLNKPTVKSVMDTPRAVSVLEADDYTAGNSGSIITDQKRDRFHLVPATWNALKQWVSNEQADWEKRVAEKKAAVPKVRAIETRKEVIEKAAAQSALAPKDDHRQVVARRPEPAATPKPAAVMEIKGKDAVPKPAWSHFEGEASKEEKVVTPKPAIPTPPQPLLTPRPEFKPLAAKETPKTVSPVAVEVKPEPKPVIVEKKPEPVAVSKPAEPKPVEVPKAILTSVTPVTNKSATSFLWRHIIGETAAEEPATTPEIAKPVVEASKPEPIVPKVEVKPEPPVIKPVPEVKVTPIPPPAVEVTPVEPKPIPPPPIPEPEIEEPEEEVIEEPTPVTPSPVSVPMPRYESEPEDEEELPEEEPRSAPAPLPTRKFRPSPEPRSLPVWRFGLIGAFAIMLGVGLTFWFFSGQNAAVPTENQPVTVTLIKADTVVPANAINPNELLPKIAETSGDSGNSVIVIEPRVGPNSDPVAATDMLGRLNWNVPDSFERAVEKINFGRYEGQPFIVLRVTSFDIGFSGLLAGEDYLSSDLAWFFGTGSANAVTTSFVDSTVKNHDIRILRDDQDNERIVYGFVNRNIIIIAPDSDVFAGVASLVK